MGKYAKYVNHLRLWTELVRPAYRGKMADFSLIFDRKVFPEAKIWVENFHIYAPGAGVMIPHYFRRVDKPFLMVVISMTSDYGPGSFRSTPLPPGFRL